MAQSFAIPRDALGVQTHFYEYCYYRGVEMIPTWLGEGVAPLTTTQARRVRERVTDFMKQAQDGDVAVRFFRAMDQAFAEHYGDDYRTMFHNVYNPPEGSTYADSPAWRALNTSFDELLGHRGPQSSVTGEARLPVSPYDRRFAMRETMLNSGAELLAIPSSELGKTLGIYSADDARSVGLSSLAGIPEHRANATTATTNGPRRKLSESPRLVRANARGNRLMQAGDLYSEADVMGLAALRGYMSDKEYSNAVRHVRAGLNGSDGVVDPNRAMSDAALERSLAILDYLTEAGVDYSVVPDLRPGQLRARIAGENIDVRLTDVRDQEAWVGRVYNSGVTYMYSHGDTRGTQRDAVVPTRERVVDLLRYARGEHVTTADGLNAGQLTTRKENGLRTTYSVGNTGTFMTYVDEGLYIRVKNDSRSQQSKFYNTVDGDPERVRESASNDLRAFISSAHESFAEQVDVRGLLEDYVLHAEDTEWEPDYSGRPETSSLREAYWTELRGVDENEPLLVPGALRHEFEQARDNGDIATSMALLMDGDNVGKDAYLQADAALSEIEGLNAVADRDTVARLFAHQQASADYVIGSFEPDENGVRFDPTKVAAYMSAQSSSDYIDEVVAAMRAAEMTPEELRGSGFGVDMVADRLVYFNNDTAIPMDEHPEKLVQDMREVIADAVSTRGAVLSEANIDDRGVVRWKAYAAKGRKDSSDFTDKNAWTPITGELGQIFTRGEHGEIITDYGSGNNFMFVPGYEATVVRRTAEHDGTLEERTRLRGYEQIMAQAVSRAVTDTFVEGRTVGGAPTNINRVMRNIYGHRHPADFLTRTLDGGMRVEDRNALLETEALRVRYSNEMGDGATTLPVMRRMARMEGTDAEKARVLRNDNSRDPLALTDGRNMSVLDPDAAAGIFDPVITGTAKNQGLVRYLVPSAQIDDEGFIIPGDANDRVPLAKIDLAQQMQYDPHDRQNMTFSNMLQSSSMVPGVRTVMMQCGGWNFEDGIVVSKEFAQTQSIIGGDGQIRSLTIGDKLSDFHGNKGVISLVVDPEMSDEDAAEAGLTEQVQFFRDNEDVSIIMSPFSPISRFNGGTTREMMSDPQDIIVRDNDGDPQVVAGGSGPLNMIVTHMSVDKKTNIYDREAVAEGRGRKASSQLAWALQAQGCTEVLHDFYKSNSSGVSNAREYLIALGMDMSPTGELLPSYESDDIETRTVFGMLQVEGKDAVKTSALARKKFSAEIAQRGGFMELPFPLTMANGEQTPQAREGEDVYLLPVLAARLRQEQDLDDGSVSYHDHTRSYLNINDAVFQYLKAERNGDLAPKDLADLRVKMQNMAQSYYNTISEDIVNRRVMGKRNMFRDGIMNNRRPYSATSVITPDSRLGVNQIAMNSAMAAELGIDVDRAKDEVGTAENTQGRYVLGWRDPVLRSGAVRYFEVVIDETYQAVAMNPLSAKSMDADYDGDTLGFVGNLSFKAHREAMDKLSVEMNLLDKGVSITQPDGSVTHPLALHDSLDIQVAVHADPSRREFLDNAVRRLNEMTPESFASREEYATAMRDEMEDLNSFFQECFADKSERIVLQFDSVGSHLASVARLHETGAKGSAKKVEEYKDYARFVTDEKGRSSTAPDKDAHDMYIKHQDSQLATSYKTQLTGVAGAVSQAQAQVFRVLGDMEIATQLTYPVTQAMLQAKHDPVDARYRAETLDGPVKHLWRGHVLEQGADPETGRYTWLPATVLNEETGRYEYVQATKEQFVQQFTQMFVDDKGMGVAINTEYVEKAADMLAGDDGRIIDMDRRNWENLPDERKPLTLDRLAYNATLDDVIDAASRRESLFAGLNETFMPAVVRSNIALESAQVAVLEKDHDGQQLSAREADVLEREEQRIGARDVVADYSQSARRSDVVDRRRRAERSTPAQSISLVEAPASAQKDDGGMEF